MKYCRDCAFLVGSSCYRDVKYETVEHPVTGKSAYMTNTLNAGVERYSGECGPEGIYWTRKSLSVGQVLFWSVLIGTLFVLALYIPSVNFG